MKLFREISKKKKNEKKNVYNDTLIQGSYNFFFSYAAYLFYLPPNFQLVEFLGIAVATKQQRAALPFVFSFLQ